MSQSNTKQSFAAAARGRKPGGKHRQESPASVDGANSKDPGVVKTANTQPEQASRPRNHRNRPGCRTSEYQPPGAARVGLDKDNQPSRIVLEVQYGLSKTARDVLVERHPGVAIVSVGAQDHDHPIAHTSRRIVWDHSVLNKLPRGGRVLDLYGDPTANERYNARSGEEGMKIDTIARVITPKDATRQARWGPRVRNGQARWHDLSHYDLWRNAENATKYAEYDVMIGNHVGYYFTLADINRLVNLRRPSDDRAGMQVVLTLHRHGAIQDGRFEATKSGYLNGREQYWERFQPTPGGAWHIRQTNVHTGEEYVHPDTEQFFRNFAYADVHGGMAWTINLGCAEHYVLTFTSCPREIVEPHFWLDGVMQLERDGDVAEIRAAPAKVASVAPPTYEDAVRRVCPARLFGGIKVPDPAWTQEVQIQVTHPALLRTLELWMINKPRTAAVLKDLTAKAQRECGNSTLIGGTGKKLGIDSRELREHIMLAFVSGAEQESMLAAAALGSQSRSTTRLLAGRNIDLTSPYGVLKTCMIGYFDLMAVSRGLKSAEQATNMLETWT